MRHVLVSFLLSILAAAPQTSLERMKADAEREYSEKSFRRAHEIYEQMAKLDLPADERRFVELRLADTAWRADAASPDNDPTARNAASAALSELVNKWPHDRLWADAMSWPLVWDGDLKEWIAGWQEQGILEIQGMKPRQRVPHLSESNLLVWKPSAAAWNN